jgi:hypothetical protein
LPPAGGREVVDYAFTRGGILVGIVLAAALIYRLVSAKLGTPRRSMPETS